MGWLYTTMPIAGVEIWWPGLIVLGLGVGIIGGFFGMAGAWMVTPGLNALGFPMAFAIGTDITHMAGKSLISTMRHAKFGNVDYKLSLIMVFGTSADWNSALAISCGWSASARSTSTYGAGTWCCSPGSPGWCSRTSQAPPQGTGGRRRRAPIDPWPPAWNGTKPCRRSSSAHGPFPKAGIRCSAWLPIAVAFFTGWLAGVLGIGGGLIRMPSLIYLIGCPTHVAVGTDLFEIVVSGLYGAATYSYKGRVELWRHSSC